MDIKEEGQKAVTRIIQIRDLFKKATALNDKK
jgi:hypothetical protein